MRLDLANGLLPKGGVYLIIFVSLFQVLKNSPRLGSFQTIAGNGQLLPVHLIV